MVNQQNQRYQVCGEKLCVIFWTKVETPKFWVADTTYVERSQLATPR